MQIPRRVYYATLVSLLIHGGIFGVLALTTRFTPDFQKYKEEALMAIAPIPEEPLEVVFHAAPPKPEPPEPNPPAMPMAPKPLDDAAQAEVVALRTRLDPRQIQHTDTAPANAEVIASEHSKATRARGRAERTTALPRPTPLPVAGGQPLFRTAAPVSDPSGPASLEPDALPDPDDSEALEESDAGSVAALGDWRQALANAIGIPWETYRNSKKEALRVGTVTMRFRIDAEGKVSKIEVVSNTGGPNNAIYATRAILEAKIPPIPAERVQKLPGGTMAIEFKFTIYPY